MTSYKIENAEALLTPALVIYPEIVDQNIAATLRLLGGDANCWRPHLKTAKLGFIMRKLVERQIREGINFLVPCGTTGESPTLTRAEHLRVVEITIEEARKAGRKVPVVGGAGGYNTVEVNPLFVSPERTAIADVLLVPA